MNKFSSIRKDWSLIETLIEEDRRILDIGCGDAKLMRQLESNIKATTHGIEINRDLALQAISNGFNVIHGNAENDLSQYSNNSFDYVILSQTLQAMVKPKEILSELLRIGSKAIVSFPNFAHWRVRFHLGFKGRMPVSETLPFQWYETPNIHFCTIKDFNFLCKEMGIVVQRSMSLDNSGSAVRRIDLAPFLSNFFGEQAVFLLKG